MMSETHEKNGDTKVEGCGIRASKRLIGKLNSRRMQLYCKHEAGQRPTIVTMNAIHIKKLKPPKT